MKTRTVSIAVAALWLAGCATPQPVHEQPGLSAPGTGAADGVHPRGEKDAAVPPGGQASLKMPPLVAAPRIDLPPEPEPDAVIKIDPATGDFSPGMASRLEKIADAARADERIIVRLESYVREGGSTAFSIGIADKLLHRVRERLQALGVASRRILLANFGAEYARPRDPYRHWVDIYLLKPTY
jgi:hypothetical protein